MATVSVDISWVITQDLELDRIWSLTYQHTFLNLSEHHVTSLVKGRKRTIRFWNHLRIKMLPTLLSGK